MQPTYLNLYRSGELQVRAERALAKLSACDLCPRRCFVDRYQGTSGFCQCGRKALVASSHPHFGEESVLVGHQGSGTIFFGSCNLRCSFCQNFGISQAAIGQEVEASLLAQIMLGLQSEGCHNINLVTPSHVVPQILEALLLAIEAGLYIPLVYNSSGYDAVETLRLLEGVVDIYLPDFKFWQGHGPERFCEANDYPEIAKAALQEMYRQVGDLVIDEEGLARQGLLVRHLVMPGQLNETEAILVFLASLSDKTYVNVMDQYHPCGSAMADPEIGRRITLEEYKAALGIAKKVGLQRFDRFNRICRKF